MIPESECELVEKLSITVLIAAKIEELNIAGLPAALGRVSSVVVINSHRLDRTAAIAARAVVEAVQFDYKGGYPRSGSGRLTAEGFSGDFCGTWWMARHTAARLVLTAPARAKRSKCDVKWVRPPLP